MAITVVGDYMRSHFVEHNFCDHVRQCRAFDGPTPLGADGFFFLYQLLSDSLRVKVPSLLRTTSACNLAIGLIL